MSKKRKCKTCGACLCRYNHSQKCWVHSEISYVEWIPATKATSYSPSDNPCENPESAFSKIRQFKIRRNNDNN